MSRHSVRLLHEKGSLFVFANQHNMGLINYTFQRLGIPFVNHIVWQKPNGVPISRAVDWRLGTRCLSGASNDKAIGSTIEP